MALWPWWSYRKSQQLRQIEEKILHAAKNKPQTKKAPLNQNHWELFLKDQAPLPEACKGMLVRSWICMGFPCSMEFLAATPIKQDMAPSRLPADCLQGSAWFGSRKILFFSRVSPPPCPPAPCGIGMIVRSPKFFTNTSSSSFFSSQG